MGTLALNADERVESVEFSEEFLIVGLKDGRRISVPIEWYPRLARASRGQLANWQVCDGGYGIHWPEIDEDLSTEGLLRGAPAPDRSLNTDAG
ncbi:MAG: DUF2442 domain-containing protein [Pseudomonadota bacterium]